MSSRVDIDSYLSWRFHLRDRNCWHLVRSAWKELTGRDLGERTPETITRAALIGRFETDAPTFTELNAPGDPSIVLMTRRGVVPHVGVHFDRRVLQMTTRGASYTPLPLACLGFERVRFLYDR